MAIGIMLIGLMPGPAHAGFTLAFDQANYQIGPGQGVDVRVFLTESGTNILSTAGLSSAGLVLSFNLPTMTSDPAQVTSIASNPGVNDADDFLFTSITPATAIKVGAAELMFSVLFSDDLKPSTGSSSILLGTFHFVAGSLPGQVTHLSTSISPGGPQFFSGTGQELDSMIATSTATITTQAVPEPAGAILMAIGLIGTASYGRFRRHAQGR